MNQLYVLFEYFSLSTNDDEYLVGEVLFYCDKSLTFCPVILSSGFLYDAQHSLQNSLPIYLWSEPLCTVAQAKYFV